MKSIRKSFLYFFKYGVPLILIAWPMLVIYDLINPWPPAHNELSKHQNSLVMLVGVQSNYKGTYTKLTKTYLAIKTNPLSSTTISISSDSNGQQNTISENGGLTNIIFTYLFLIVITCWFWSKHIHITSHSSLLRSLRSLHGTPRKRGAP